jgi:hypothetical protein
MIETPRLDYLKEDPIINADQQGNRYRRCRHCVQYDLVTREHSGLRFGHRLHFCLRFRVLYLVSWPGER